MEHVEHMNDKEARDEGKRRCVKQVNPKKARDLPENTDYKPGAGQAEEIGAERFHGCLAPNEN